MTRAVFFYRALVQRKLCVFQIKRARRSERRSIARQTCWQHAIEHVHPTRDHLQQLRRCAQSHGVAWFVSWQKWFSRFDSSHHFLFRFADANAPNRVTIEVELNDCLRALLAQIIKRRALDDAE